MKILFIGYSNVLKKRIIPILDRLDFVDSVCIAKLGDRAWDDSYKNISKPVELFDSYENAINNSNASIAYITTANNSHFGWAKATLSAGMHTIIDKPATIHFHQTEELLSIAKKRQLLVAESTVYTYHPQMDLIRNIIKQNDSEPRLLTAQFSFPPMNRNNFRYDKESGGGAFLDTSPYVVSLGRYFFNSVPEQCTYVENAALEDGLEISYSILLKYTGGRVMIGHFGFNTEYVNRLSILGDKICVDVERVFTIPDSEANPVKVRINNEIFEVTAPSGNAFALYLAAIGESLKTKDFKSFYSDIRMDAFARHLIHNKTNKDSNGN